MKTIDHRWMRAFALLVLLAGCAQPLQDTADAQFDVKIIAFNDFHGHVEGRAAPLAAAIGELKKRNPHHAVVSAGDLIGASPLVSALFLDEPTIDVFNLIGLDFNAVGNHEFDRGQDELLRLAKGGCARHHLRMPCRVNPDFGGARFGFLAANVERADGSTLLPASGIKAFTYGGQTVKVGFVGVTLRGTPQLVSAAGIQGLQFNDEAETANREAESLRSQGAAAVVVLLHQGGYLRQAAADGSCTGMSGPLTPLLPRLSTAIDVVVSGHTHQAYVCTYAEDGRRTLVTSSGAHGTMLTEIDLRIDVRRKAVAARSARNLVIAALPGAATGTAAERNGQLMVAPDQEVERLVKRYAEAARPLAAREAGRLQATARRDRHPGGDSPLGNLIADAQLAATRGAEQGGAVIALMNPGGVRTDLTVPEGGGSVSYADLFSVQPFGNTLVVKRMTGEQLRRVLEQQFADPSRPRILSPSHNFSYRYRASAAPGERVSDMVLDGEPVQPGEAYHVTINSFLAGGGDGFSVFREGTEVAGGILDIEALEAYLRAHSPVRPPVQTRLTRLD